jgi:UDP-3-O-acyl-N-acetylglucosamine deacetylase
MAFASTTGSLGSDSSTNERYGRSDVMNSMLAEQMCHYRIDSLMREIEAESLATLAKGGTIDRPVGVRNRVVQTADRLRLVLRGSAA